MFVMSTTTNMVDAQQHVNPIWWASYCDANNNTIVKCPTPSTYNWLAYEQMNGNTCYNYTDTCNDKPTALVALRLISNNGKTAQFSTYKNITSCVNNEPADFVMTTTCNSCDPKDGNTLLCTLSNSASTLVSFGVITIVGVVSTMLFL
ncbi:hypothetical protein SAMD00019534_113290 [Acytostelium subglobosum LB1]|uniref:hypothetical protein n=1 Tax=Acytostelium subglobosum LB1 TaxID=1410327 RepID=UPI000644E59E|nr:hypothetical protein SAMD00019534_113290 [Acytostelium subglobosum LB1]GAM28153.1 hypothetical protein SAMD00019534_113290 [Acytostelium subglobosum LB1]|eukprot:XP_012748787.1 hypothetical protein SAMD00019534_113290 [Acytostelium subglobosum LB1]